MINRLATARESVQIFFPKKPLPGSAYARKRRRWDGPRGIKRELQELLQSEPSIVPGYQLTEGRGMWFNEKTGRWARDDTCEIQAYVLAGFASELASANQRNPARQFLARISRLSCTWMGHEGFMTVVAGRAEAGNKLGMKLGEQILPYEFLLERGRHL
jgi:hypothetical protein